MSATFTISAIGILAALLATLLVTLLMRNTRPTPSRLTPKNSRRPPGAFMIAKGLQSEETQKSS